MWLTLLFGHSLFKSNTPVDKIDRVALFGSFSYLNLPLVNLLNITRTSF